MLRVMLVAAAAVIVGACNTTPQNAGGSNAAAPQNYRRAVAEHARKTFFDPYSVRDAEIASPKLAAGPSLNTDGGFYTPWVVCMRANAKNRMGAYTGRQVTAVAMNGNQVVNSWDEAHFSGMVCADATYEPFPEIEEGHKPPIAADQKARGKR